MNYIDQCEQEPLHLSGEIQPHGALVIASPDGIVRHLSANAALFLGLDSDLNVGSNITDCMAHLLRPSERNGPTHDYKTFHSPDQRLFDVTVTDQEELQCFEFTAVERSTPNMNDALPLPATLGDKSERNLIRTQLLKWIQKLTGHERIIYYHFTDNGDGQVLDEVCIDKAMGSYLDLRFPASDIPQIARLLYSKNPWREIPAADQEPVLVLGTGDKPNLTLTDLRSVSPMHRQYMANMGINSSVSFPLMKQGKLDALISCHSRTSLKLPLRALRKVSSVVGTFNLLQRELESRQRQELLDELASTSHPIQGLIKSGEALPRLWSALSSQIIHQFKADGVVLCGDGWALSRGDTPDLAALECIDEWFVTEQTSMFWSDHLSELIPDLPLTEVCGISAIKFQPQNQNILLPLRLYVCRSEHIHEVSWGGNPNKPTESLRSGESISPRLSFEKWVEKRLGYSRPWPSTIDIQLLYCRRLLESWEINLDIH